MRFWVLAAVAGLAVFTVAGFGVTYVMKLRRSAALKQCEFNLAGIALFAAHNAHPELTADATKLLREIPAGTVVLPGVPPEERVSWFVRVLPGLDQKRQNTAPLITAIDAGQPWPVEKNQHAARTKLVAVLCPGNPPEFSPNQPAPTQYVGIAGLGRDAATLNFTPPEPAPPRAGCFRYNAPTPFSAITDGLSQTLLLGERSADLGPWLRGGPSTVRGIDDTPGAQPVIGTGGQFGGNHAAGANWAMADGAVRFMTDRTDPNVLFRLATIAGREADAVPGE